MRERRKFVEAMLDGQGSMTELCRVFGISRKTGYKWWARYQERGVLGLAELSRASQTHPNETDERLVELVVQARRAHPTWGPRKLREWLLRRKVRAPAASTIGAILRREGLARVKRRQPRAGEYTDGLSSQHAANAVWAADFKGHFKLRDSRACYPLTISDGFSRYLLRCTALERPDGVSVQKGFESAFREFGLPVVIRTDNGSPFSSPVGISALSMWWVKLGVQPERIERGKPTQNGRHERIHRTLKADAIQSAPPQASFAAQQRVFDRFRAEYNHERPHEALGQKPPAEVYEPSLRRYPTRLREPEYGDGFEVQRVRYGGFIEHRGELIFLTKLLRGEPVGLLRNDAGELSVHYGPLELGIITASGRLRRGRKRQQPSESNATRR